MRCLCWVICVSNHGVKIMSMTKLTFYRAEVMEQLIQSSDLFVMQVEMDVYTALKKVHWKNDILYSSQIHILYSDLFLRTLFVIFSLCSGCSCSSISRGTAQSSSFWLTLMPGSANAGQVQWGHILGKHVFFLFDLLKTGFAFQICVRKSPSWAQRRARLFVPCSNTCVSSISSTIWHLHASWRETIFCPLVRCDIIKSWISSFCALEKRNI